MQTSNLRRQLREVQEQHLEAERRRAAEAADRDKRETLLKNQLDVLAGAPRAMRCATIVQKVTRGRAAR